MRRKNKTISFYTLGCRLNQSETAVIEHTFKEGGYQIVDFENPADTVVINTCTVTENGDADTRRLVNKISRINPQARIALVGCQAQIQKEKLASLANVHWVVGNAKKMDLKSIIEETERQDQGRPTHLPEVITPTIPREEFTIPIAGIDRHHTRANIKIQDGCDFFCSFCEIPYARGRARSRKFDDILKEANALVSAGHREIVITGINVGTYRQNNKCMMDVIEALEQIGPLQRIRISSIEPTTIPEKLLEKMAKKTKLCRYLHIPLQSGNDQILEAMKRKYQFNEFLTFIRKASEMIPEICIGTDVIVGFPGESDELFNDTVEKLKSSPIHYFHVFSYSQRNLAKSRMLRDVVPGDAVKERSRILRSLSERKRRLFYASLVGTTQKVLFEQNKNGLWSGLTDHYARVMVESTKDLSNCYLDVKLDAVDHTHLLGKLL